MAGSSRFLKPLAISYRLHPKTKTCTLRPVLIFEQLRESSEWLTYITLLVAQHQRLYANSDPASINRRLRY